MSKEQDNKAIVGRWFTDFWGKTCDLGIVDELAAPDMPRRARRPWEKEFGYRANESRRSRPCGW